MNAYILLCLQNDSVGDDLDDDEGDPTWILKKKVKAESILHFLETWKKNSIFSSVKF